MVQRPQVSELSHRTSRGEGSRRRAKGLGEPGLEFGQKKKKKKKKKTH